MGFKVNVSIISATGIGGVFPFVVVCLDGELSNELHKTDAIIAAPTCVWNATFELDLKTLIKAHVAAGHPEPTYLTFFIFDTGASGVPSLGSAGVLLSTVHEQGIAQGEFQVVNGTGTLSLAVSDIKYKPEEEHQAWYATNTAKVAAGAGVTALAAGIGAVALNHHKKKKKGKEAAASVTGSYEGSRGISENDESDEGEDNAQYQPPRTTARLLEEDSSEEEDQVNAPNGTVVQPEYHEYETAEAAQEGVH